jgi:hypothetical protein
MAITSARVNIQFHDAHRELGSTAFDSILGITAAQVEALIPDIEAISNARSCSYSITQYGEIPLSGSPVDAMYPDKFTLARFSLISPIHCTSRLSLAVPAPLHAIFTGAMNVEGDVANAAIVTLSASLSPLVRNADGTVGYVIDNFYRDTIAMSKPRA